MCVRERRDGEYKMRALARWYRCTAKGSSDGGISGRDLLVARHARRRASDRVHSEGDCEGAFRGRRIDGKTRVYERYGNSKRQAATSFRPLLVGVFMLSWAAAAAHAQEEVSPCQALVEAGASSPEVRQCYISQTQRNPSDPAVWMALGTDFHTEGETLEAATAYRNVIEMAPKSDLAAKAHLHLGVIFHSQGEMDEALDAYRESVALHPNADTLLNMAIILHQRGDHAEALESCQRAIDVRPEYFAAYAQMAIMQQSSGDILKAIATYQQAIELKPDYGPAYFNLGTAFEHAGDLPKAIEQYQTAITLEDAPEDANPKFHSRLAAALVEAGQMERDITQHHDISRHCRPLGSRNGSSPRR